ncbi:MAG: hypothetical protein KZQ93_12755 [Candidatus Thiodiazotropha sp. (ex Monitilora ramsayi)]|nr:hypothetical protein [Candidatus Thiodiazotropha sp. (ex Monitilora ramsayi)]
MQEWDVLTGISSVVIALCAFLFTLWSGWRVHTHNKLSVKPHLTTWITTDANKHYYSIDLLNNGLGPALIDRFEVIVDGQLLFGNATEPVENAIKTLFPENHYEYRSSVGLVGSGYSMPVNEKRLIASVHFSNVNPPLNEHVINQIKRCSIKITYKSFYGKKYTYSSNDEVFL